MVGSAQRAGLADASLFYANRDCPYFPCHDGIPDADYNCKFCYCPLYMLGADCPGEPRFTQQGLKDCSGCTLPHKGVAGAKCVVDVLSAVLPARAGEESRSDVRDT